MLHKPAVEVGKDHSAAKKAKLGVILFFVYTIIYAGFVLIGLTNPELMGLEIIGGQNIAIIYGFGLIYKYHLKYLESFLPKPLTETEL